ncbi:hypothetical protein L7F22_040102 [Adiantum nelumboides]|nr:hypothetical protein [Adiantum nelumboides]
MEGFLDRGYIICVPDYEGQRDSFGSGYDAAYCTLDSMRAVLKFSQTLKLAEPSAVKIIGWGYSGGAIAIAGLLRCECGFSFLRTLAARKCEKLTRVPKLDIYAPELSENVVGWSMGGVPVDLRSVALSVNDTIASGLIIGVVQGLANSYPKLQKWINDNTTDDGKKIFATATGPVFQKLHVGKFQKGRFGPDQRIQ